MNAIKQNEINERNEKSLTEFRETGLRYQDFQMEPSVGQLMCL